MTCFCKKCMELAAISWHDFQAKVKQLLTFICTNIHFSLNIDGTIFAH